MSDRAFHRSEREALGRDREEGKIGRNATDRVRERKEGGNRATKEIRMRHMSKTSTLKQTSPSRKYGVGNARFYDYRKKRGADLGGEASEKNLLERWSHSK